MRHYAELKSRTTRSHRGPDRRSRRRAASTCPALYERELCERSGLMSCRARATPGVPDERHRAYLADINRFPFPDDSPVPVAGGHLRPHGDRDRPRLHRGLPLLPGGDDLPPGAGAADERTSIYIYPKKKKEREKKKKKKKKKKNVDGDMEEVLAYIVSTYEAGFEALVTGTWWRINWRSF